MIALILFFFFFPLPPGDHQIPPALTPETDNYPVSKENIAKVFNGISLGLGYSDGRKQFDLPAWDEVLEHNAKGFPSTSTSLETEAAATGDIPKHIPLTFGELLTDVGSIKQQDDSKQELQVPCLYPSIIWIIELLVFLGIA